MNCSTAVTVPKRPRCRDYDEKGFCMRGDQCKFDHGSDAVVLEVINWLLGISKVIN